MINQKKNSILTRLLNLEPQNFERQNSFVRNIENQNDKNNELDETQEQTTNQIQDQCNCKATLKRNIFANTIINKNAHKLVKIGQNGEQNLNILQNEPIDDVMITDLERQIYEQLDQLGIRLADPLELQNNYYQRVRSGLLSQDEIQSERFLTPKICHSQQDIETRASSQPLFSSDENIESSKSADLKFNESKIYLKRSSFKRPIILQQYSKSNTSEQSY
ncbi:hypothetical protein TTHERM_00532210 (macronuclear) [Tetrahymena thermophila SB210]|uniref:Uncharacterized protein n=1 Tax=Tetrahymena thermophila (strain SB210) TaxID=312017 RepID=Q248E6_TETTS|nr:hypothetical protein TTHERM_00532210 [Tetrahymena thermophila SB210]EAS04099.1 hypothetical protein TTHERM_00532210 [Tetrahymena thermophila SB210]|eukprot:XP_001024344.1 hypothetical protein TTHERM_00532210 [Tetrahymena thermophila SB210]